MVAEEETGYYFYFYFKVFLSIFDPEFLLLAYEYSINFFPMITMIHVLTLNYMFNTHTHFFNKASYHNFDSL